MAAALLLGASAAQAAPVDDLLAEYQSQGAGPFSAKAGKTFWTKGFPNPDGGAARSCATCHTGDPRKGGQHADTGKLIDPLAPSVNPQRLTDPAFMAKWLKRNGTWVTGAELSPQIKGDVLTYLRNL
ncbi:MAG: hypothetical protein COX57_03805 [Alphaproteobacteria bacterium CG_4_10_14_0_2_um_filter_63_37]|nr:MAG: hypothetical protein COX57_03805 [Alphaproteobacteria bacterium CG_4_10_14_0_2_um_filter_63_37]